MYCLMNTTNTFNRHLMSLGNEIIWIVVSIAICYCSFPNSLPGIDFCFLVCTTPPFCTSVRLPDSCCWSLCSRSRQMVDMLPARSQQAERHPLWPDLANTALSKGKGTPQLRSLCQPELFPCSLQSAIFLTRSLNFRFLTHCLDHRCYWWFFNG